MIYADFESILVPRDNGKQNIPTIIKNMLLVVMVINNYLLMINLIRFLSHTKAMMLLTILLAI